MVLFAFVVYRAGLWTRWTFVLESCSKSPEIDELNGAVL